MWARDFCSVNYSVEVEDESVDLPASRDVMTPLVVHVTSLEKNNSEAHLVVSEMVVPDKKYFIGTSN